MNGIKEGTFAYNQNPDECYFQYTTVRPIMGSRLVPNSYYRYSLDG